MTRYDIAGCSEFWYLIDCEGDGSSHFTLHFKDESRIDGSVDHESEELAVSVVMGEDSPTRHSAPIASADGQIHFTCRMQRSDEGFVTALAFELEGAVILTLSDSDLPPDGVLVEAEVDATIVPESFGLWLEDEAPVEGSTTFSLDRELGIVATLGASSERRPQVRIEVGEQAESIPAALAVVEERTGDGIETIWQLHAPLPGWIWTCAEDGGTVRLKLLRNGNAVARLDVSQAEVIERIEQVARTCEPTRDAVTALSCLEHIVHGQLGDRLSPEAVAFARRVAAVYNVGAFLGAAGLAPGPAAMATAPRGRSISDDLVTQAVRYGSALAVADAGAIPDGLDRLIRDHSLSPAQAEDVFLQLAEGFILAGRFGLLADAAARTGTIELPLSANNWRKSLWLPFALRQGRIEEIADALWSMNVDDGWIVTPAIAWVLKELVRAETQSTQQAAIVRKGIYAYMHLVRQMAATYWGRAQCSAMIDASCALLDAAADFSDYLREDVEKFVLECHGLSREFWARVAENTQTARSPCITTAKIHFDRIAEEAGRPELMAADAADAVTNALRFFVPYCPAVALRFLREVLPLSRQLDCLTQGVAGFPAERRSVSGEVMRVAAHPGFTGDAAVLEPHLRAAISDTQRNGEGSQALSAIRESVPRLHATVAALLHPDAPAVIDTGPAEATIGRLMLCGAPHKAVELAAILATALSQAGRREAALRALARLASLIANVGTEHDIATAGVRAALGRLASLLEREGTLAAFIAMLPEEGRHPVLADVSLAGPDRPLAAADLVFDTIVTIISCRKYLDDRMPAIMASYVGRLRELGIPYVFVVGGTETRLDGDVLTLDCPDDYEHLPEKMLGVIDWVERETRYGYMLKIDDDCYLNVDEYFFGHSYRDADYHGRRIDRPVGGMDRMWHMRKSSTLRARHELDKSPEPSTYADGGSSYTLSRRAMRTVVEALRSPAGAMIKNASYMEDKLIGDLLRSSGILVNGTDLTVSVFRLLPETGVAVSMYANGFLPSRVWPVRVTHLDTPSLFPLAHRQSQAATLRPHKIWPSYATPATGNNSNALDLVSDREAAEALASADVAVVACMRNEIGMLPSFLDHYRRLGVGAFLIADNCSTDGSLAYLLAQPDVVTFSCDTEYKESTYGVAWQQALLSAFRRGRWSVVVDADELLVHPGYPDWPLIEALRRHEAAGHDAVMALLLDMYPQGDLAACDLGTGDPFALAPYTDCQPLEPLWFYGPYSNSVAWTSALRHRLVPDAGASDFTAQKTCILRYAPWMQLSAGLHYAGDCRIADDPMVLCHFKFHAGFHRKVLEEVARKQHFAGASEYRKYLDALEAGRSFLYDPAVSVRWTEAETVREAMAGRLRLSWPSTRLRHPIPRPGAPRAEAPPAEAALPRAARRG